MPDDWRDESLRRAALWLNDDKDTPAVFSDESLAYLDELAYTLPRRGILFTTAAQHFIFELAISTLPVSDAEIAKQVRNLQQRKEIAVANLDWETARACRDQQDEFRVGLRQCRVHQICPDEIRTGLLRVGVDPDAGTTVGMSGM